MRQLASWISVGCLGILGTHGFARAEVLDTSFSAVSWANVGNSATGFEWAPDRSNRLFVTIKEGAVRVIENGALLPTPFASETVHAASECGVIGIAFDPNFVQNHYVYVFATVSNSEQQIIRYTANGNVGSERTVIMRNLPTTGNNHDGGAVGFGPDGKLYWAIGDLGNATGVNADLATLAAKVGRANRDGSVPNDNPFVDGDGPNNDWIWARGFRNPFTFTFQPATGSLWVNSVGSLWEQVFIVRKSSHAGFSNYENNQPDGFLAPVISYGTNRATTGDLDPTTGAVRNANVVTFTTTTAHRMRTGAKVTIAGVSATSFNATYFVSSVPNATTFTVAQTGPNETSAAGTFTSPLIGGSITGGTFLATSAVPAAYRGNFFFADYNTGVVQRVTLASNVEVTSVDDWARSINGVTDVSLGPDGALYMLEIGGEIHRASYNATAQGLVVTPTHVRMDEAGSAAVAVRLAMPPASDISVLALLQSHPELTLGSGQPGETLTFTAANWATPQLVQIAAGRDLDADEDTGTLTFSSNGLASESTFISVTDEGSITLVLSTGTLPVSEGESTTFTVALSRAPMAPLTVAIERASGDANVNVTEGAQLTFTPANWSTPQTVRIAAAEDDDNSDTSAQLQLTSPAIPSRTVEVAVDDNDEAAPAFTSSPRTLAVAGALYTYDADASGRPAPTFTLPTRPDGMTIDAATGLITWTPPNAGQFSVAVIAANGVEPEATQSFMLEVAEDRAPMCTITRPASGEILEGTRAEFYGDVLDDVRAARAVFQIDDTDFYTDVNEEGHYHAGGAHNLFDTTQFSNGPHRLSLVGYDSKGQMCAASVDVTIDNGLADAGAPDAAAGDDAGNPSDASDASDAGDAGDAGRVTNMGRDSDGCSCRIATQQRAKPARVAAWGFGVLLLLAVRRRRRAVGPAVRQHIV